MLQCAKMSQEKRMSSVNLPRVTARIDSDTQELLTQAASLIGISSINSFVLSAAIEKANKILTDFQTIKLNEKATKDLLQYLDEPVVVNENLKALFKKPRTIEID